MDMKIVLISDTHGDHRKLELPAADTIVHAGDLSAHGDPEEVREFIKWFDQLDYANKLLIAGNHDWYMESHSDLIAEELARSSIHYLNDSGVVIQDIRFWGSPITPVFFDWAFQRQQGDEIAEHWALIPKDTQILITHGPPYGIMDLVPEQDGSLSHAGCHRLLQRVQDLQPDLHIFGHIHEGFGELELAGTRFLNVCSMNSNYQIHNPPVVVEYSTKV